MATILQWSQALLTPTLGMIGLYIAWQQWQAHKLKLKLDRYDRRVAIYREVIKVLSIILRDADITPDDLLRFRSTVAESDFLFKRDVPDYIDEIYKRGLKLWRCNTQYREHVARHQRGEPPAPSYDNAMNTEEMHAELTWLTDQLSAAKEKFRLYLDVAE